MQHEPLLQSLLLQHEYETNAFVATKAALVGSEDEVVNRVETVGYLDRARKLTPSPEINMLVIYLVDSLGGTSFYRDIISILGQDNQVWKYN